MTKQDYIDRMEKARTHSLTKRWNYYVIDPEQDEEVEPCAFCVIGDCCFCLLNIDNICCNGLWSTFEVVRTKENAQAIFDFIKNIDIQASADKLEKRGYFEK